MTPDTNSENKPQTITLQYTPGPHDWQDPIGTDNAMNQCSLCRWMFWGHKHRVVCRTCTEKAARETEASIPQDLTPDRCPTCGSDDKERVKLATSMPKQAESMLMRCPDPWHNTPSDAATPAPEPWRPKYGVGDRVRHKREGSVGVIHEYTPSVQKYDVCFGGENYTVICSEDELEPAPTEAMEKLRLDKACEHIKDPQAQAIIRLIAQQRPDLPLFWSRPDNEDDGPWVEFGGSVNASTNKTQPICVRVSAIEAQRPAPTPPQPEPPMPSAGDACCQLCNGPMPCSCKPKAEPTAQAAAITAAFTPLTDQAQAECAKLGGDFQVWYGYMSEHARRLETQLALAQSSRMEPKPFPTPQDVMNAASKKHSRMEQAKRNGEQASGELPSVEELVQIFFTTPAGTRDSISAVREACMKAQADKSTELMLYGQLKSARARAEAAEQTIADLRRENAELKNSKATLQHAACLALATDASRQDIMPGLEWSEAMKAVEKLKSGLTAARESLRKVEEERDAVSAKNDWNAKQVQTLHEGLHKAKQEYCQIVGKLAKAHKELASLKASSGWVDFITQVEKDFFRTVHDTGANPSVMMMWNVVRRHAGLEELSHSDLPEWDGKRYVMPENSKLLTNKLPTPPPSPEEQERREFETWWTSTPETGLASEKETAFRAWQAARKTKGQP